MILRHRRLFTLSLLTLLSVFISQALPHAVKAFLFWGLFAAFLVLVVLFLLRKIRLTALLALLLAALAVLSSYQVSAKRSVLAPYEERTLLVSVTVYSITKEEEERVGGVGEVHFFGDAGESIKARVRFSSPTEATAGTVLYGKAVFYPVDSTYDEANGLYGNVVFHACRAVDHRYGPRFAVGELRDGIAARLRTAVPGEEGELLCALLLGVRDGLSDTFNRDMTRIGTAHMLSLSGLHLAVLTGGVGALLRRLSINKRLRLGILALFAVAFMILTGLSTSVMRAGFMLLFSTLPLFLREERDSFSSLGASVAIICLCEPYAVADASLWLSALSTLGILLFFERTGRKRDPDAPFLRRCLRAVGVSLGVTLAASIATLPLTLCLFGTVPLLSPLANLFLGVPTQFALYLALIIAITGNFSPPVALARWLSSAIIQGASHLSDIPRTVLSVETGLPFVLTSVFAVSLLLYFLLCPRKRFGAFVPLLLSVSLCLTVVLPPAVARIARGERLSLLYVTAEREETDCLYLERGDERLMIVFSPLATLGRAERVALAHAAHEIDGFLLPYYTDGSLAYVTALVTKEKVGTLYLPAPESAGEWRQYKEMCALCRESGVRATAYPRKGAFFFGSLTVSRLFAADGAYGPSSVLCELLFGYTRIQYYSAGALGYTLQYDVQRADVLIFGRFLAPSRYRFEKEDFIPSDATVLCPSPALFPFRSADGIAFAPVSHILIE